MILELLGLSFLSLSPLYYKPPKVEIGTSVYKANLEELEGSVIEFFLLY